MPVSPYGGYEETLTLKLASEGVEKVKKDLKGFGKQVGITTKGLLGVAGALGGAALGMGLLFRTSSVLQTITGSLNDIFGGFVDTILVEGMPVFEDLIDVFQELLSDVLEVMIPIVRDLVDIWKILPEPLQKLILVTGILTPLLAGIIIPILILIPAVAGLSAVSLPLVAVILILAAAFAAAWLIIENKEYIFNAIQEAGRLLWDVFVGIGEFIVGFFTPYWEKLVLVFEILKFGIDLVAQAFRWFWDNILKPLGTWIANTLQPIWDAFVYAIEIVLGGIREVTGGIGAAGDAVGGFFSWIGEGLGLQHGGIVTRPGVFQVGEAGPEAVIPLDQLGGGGFGGIGGGPTTINLIIDGRVVATSVLETLRRDQQLTLRSVI